MAPQAPGEPTSTWHIPAPALPEMLCLVSDASVSPFQSAVQTALPTSPLRPRPSHPTGHALRAAGAVAAPLCCSKLPCAGAEHPLSSAALVWCPPSRHLPGSVSCRQRGDSRILPAGWSCWLGSMTRVVPAPCTCWHVGHRDARAAKPPHASPPTASPCWALCLALLGGASAEPCQGGKWQHRGSLLPVWPRGSGLSGVLAWWEWARCVGLVGRAGVRVLEPADASRRRALGCCVQSCRGVHGLRGSAPRQGSSAPHGFE